VLYEAGSSDEELFFELAFAVSWHALRNVNRRQYPRHRRYRLERGQHPGMAGAGQQPARQPKCDGHRLCQPAVRARRRYQSAKKNRFSFQEAALNNNEKPLIH
jgi:hypothetical protein